MGRSLLLKVLKLLDVEAFTVLCILSMAMFMVSQGFTKVEAGNVSGAISTNTTWTTANNPYVVTGNITVNSNATLTIESGVIVNFNNGTYIVINSGSTLNINGISGTPVIFQSNTGTTAGLWDAIYADTGSTINASFANISHAQAGFKCRGGVCLIQDSTFDKNYVGIAAYNKSSLTTKRNTFTNNTYTPLTIEPEIGTVNLGIDSEVDTVGAGNGYSGIGIAFPNGDNANVDNGCTADSCNLPQRPFAGVSNPTYVMLNTYYVQDTNDVLHIDAGVIIKFLNSATLYIGNGSNSAIDINGAAGAANNVYFTSYKDDSVGGDTNNNGASTGAVNDWAGLYINPGSSTSNNTIDYLVHNYSSNGLRVLNTQANLTINDSSFNYNPVGIAAYNKAALTTHRNTFSNCNYTPISIDLDAGAVSLGTGADADIIGAANGYSGIGIAFPNGDNANVDNGCTADSCTLPQRPFAGVTNPTYVMLGTYYFNDPNDVLHIDPGIIMKFTSGVGLNIGWGNNSAIDINGAAGAANNVYFTSYKDDSVGGDTNNNGASSGAVNDWAGLYINPGSSTSNSTIDYLVHNYSSNGLRVLNTQANLTINDSSFSYNPVGIAAYNKASLTTHRNTFSNCNYTPISLDLDVGAVSLGTGADADIIGAANGYSGIGIAFPNGDGANTDSGCTADSCTLPQRPFAGVTNPTYVMLGTYYFNDPNDVLHIDPGIIMKFISGVGLNIGWGNNSAIDINGAAGAANNVYFTSYKDDSVGGDTNNNGASTGAVNDWAGLYINPGSSTSNSTIDYLVHNYSANGLRVLNTQANLTINDSSFNYNPVGIAAYNKASLTTHRNTFSNCNYTPISLDLDVGAVSLGTGADVDIIGSANGYSGIGIAFPNGDGANTDSGCTADSCTLPQRPFAGVSNPTYVMLGTYYFNDSNDILNINSGVNIKFLNGTSLIVNNTARININATSANRVTFTSINDDTIGGDTNNNGSATSPGAGNWSGLELGGNVIHYLNYLKVKYGNNCIYFNGVTSASTTVSNSDITTCNIGLYFNTTVTPVLSALNIENNVTWAAYNNTSTTISAQNLYWGSKFGPNDSDGGGACGVNYIGGSTVRDTAANPIRYCGFSKTRFNTIINSAQYKTDGTSLIVTGGSTEELGFTTKDDVDISVANSSYNAELEIKPIGTAFDNIPNYNGQTFTSTGGPMTAVSGIPIENAAWYDNGWANRVKVLLTNTNNYALTDYQVNLTVGYLYGMKSDFSDLRFTNASNTILSHWLASKTDNSIATIWVKVDTIPANSSNYIYLYYGNPSATSSSDPNTTFILFDDFNSGIIDTNKWNSVYQGSGITTTINNGELVFSGTKIGTGWTTDTYLESVNTIPRPYIVEADAKLISTPAGEYRDFMIAATTGGAIDTSVHFYGNNSSQRDIFGYTNSGETSLQSTVTLGQWYNFKINATPTVSNLYVDNIYKNNKTTSNANRIQFRESMYRDGTSHEVRYDNIRIRKFSDTEPTSMIDINTLSNPPWFDNNWTKRIMLSISNTNNSTGTDYQVRVNVNYLNGMKSDFSDLRFTNSAGNLLPYWTETIVNDTFAVFWVKVDTLPARSVSSIFQYFGNPSATSTSDGPSVFPIFFDDFTSINPSIWSTSGNVTVTNGIVSMNRNGSDVKLAMLNPINTNVPFIAEAKYSRPVSTRNRLYLSTASSAYSPTFDYGDFNEFYWGGWTGINISNYQWVDVLWPSTSSNYSWKINDHFNNNNILSRSTSPITNAKYLNFWGTESDNSDLFIDSVFVRSYMDVDPTVTINNPIQLQNETSYHWQTRICDLSENCSDWISYGDNAESATDFRVSYQTPNVLPVASNVSIDSGAAAINLTENTTTPVHCYATVTDGDGYPDISSVEGRLYRTSLGAAGNANTNNRYILAGNAQCVPSGGNGTTQNYDCGFNVYFNADPTDIGSPFETDNWTCLITPTDSTGTGTAASDTIEMNTLVALSVTSTIPYGSVLPGADTGSSNEVTTVTNTGNKAIDMTLSGANMCTNFPTCSSNILAVNYQQYSTTAFSYGSGSALSTSPVQLNTTVNKPTQSPSDSTKDLYWGISIPSNGKPGSYTGSNTVTAVGI